MRKSILSLAMALAMMASPASSSTGHSQSKKNIKTAVVTTTPQMHCQSCENKIKGNLRFEKGVKRIETNIPNQTVTIEYDANKTTLEQLLKSFTKFGYTARPVKGTSKPEHCK